MKLAIDGGTPVRSKPYPSWPYFSQEELEAVAQVLTSGRVNYWTGEEGRSFEKEFADTCDRRFAVALANGTVALEAALYALGIGAGDEVIVPARTFIATASSAAVRGAVPICADVDLLSQNITVQTISPLLTPRTKAIIAVHLGGWPCDMPAIMNFAQAHNLKVIEDCAQAQGAKYHGRPVGSFGHLAAFSFCQDKIMTTGGEGGMLVTDNKELWNRAWSYKDHGKNYAIVFGAAPANGVRFPHESFGTNWRMTEMQSALGRAALRKLPQWVEKRRCFADILNQRLNSVPGLQLTLPEREVYHAYYRYNVLLSPELLLPGWDKSRITRAVAAEGVPCPNWGNGEIYREKAFSLDPKNLQPEDHRLPNAKALTERSLYFLVHPTLEEEDVLDVCRAVEKVFEKIVSKD